mmetsp:Transcript_33313/g.79635  ORF Transcript_33313/g.79635 Transcript_33313/m.79635 type:complete len:203 (-) Transcript_33313:721-1329(-)
MVLEVCVPPPLSSTSVTVSPALRILAVSTQTTSFTKMLPRLTASSTRFFDGTCRESGKAFCRQSHRMRDPARSDVTVPRATIVGLSSSVRALPLRAAALFLDSSGFLSSLALEGIFVRFISAFLSNPPVATSGRAGEDSCASRSSRLANFSLQTRHVHCPSSYSPAAVDCTSSDSTFVVFASADLKTKLTLCSTDISPVCPL